MGPAEYRPLPNSSQRGGKLSPCSSYARIKTPQSALHSHFLLAARHASHVQSSCSRNARDDRGPTCRRLGPRAASTRTSGLRGPDVHDPNLLMNSAMALRAAAQTKQDRRRVKGLEREPARERAPAGQRRRARAGRPPPPWRRHRRSCGAGCVRGRADLQGHADRPVDVLAARPAKCEPELRPQRARRDDVLAAEVERVWQENLQV
jgi:hypothetical protein